MPIRWFSVEKGFRLLGRLSAGAFIVTLIYFATQQTNGVLLAFVLVGLVVGFGAILAYSCTCDESPRYYRGRRVLVGPVLIAVLLGALLVIFGLLARAIWLFFSAPVGKEPTGAIALLVSFSSLIISLIGTATSSVLGARADARAENAEKRAQEKHNWEREERDAQRRVEGSGE